MQHHAGDPEIMVHHVDSGAGMNMVRCCKIIVHNRVIVALKGPTFQVMQLTPQRFPILEINAVNYLYGAGIHLSNNRSNYGHMGLLADNISYLHRDWGHAECADITAVRGTHHDISANAFLTVLVVIEHSQGEAHNQQDERDFHAYGNHADD